LEELSAAAITRDLKTSLVGREVIYYPSLTSTMEVAKRVARSGAAEGTVIIAGEQTGGWGRLGRGWLSPPGNIALSVILSPQLTYVPYLIMLASLAVVHTIESVTGLKPQIKWPNDVLVNSKKVSGILIESDIRKDKVNFAVIGVGINVSLKPADFPAIQTIATSLSGELGGEVSRVGIVRRLLVELDRLCLILPGGKVIYEEWRDRLETLGKKVRVKSGDAVYEGVAESVAENGSLLLRQPDGSLVKIVAGDVATLHI